MGAYLRKPVTEKSSTHGEQTVGGWRLRYAATAMQGWRVSMEVRQLEANRLTWTRNLKGGTCIAHTRVLQLSFIYENIFCCLREAWVLHSPLLFRSGIESWSGSTV